MSEKSEKITITLARAEALVFFEWLANLGDIEDRVLPDDVEEKVVWKIEGQLESALPEVLAPNFQELLDEARVHIQNQEQ